jgi:hypothetical protein
MVRSPFPGWSAPSNMAIPSELPVKSAQISGDSVRNCSGSGVSRDCRKSELPSLKLLNIGLLGISLNFGPKSAILF